MPRTFQATLRRRHDLIRAAGAEEQPDLADQEEKTWRHAVYEEAWRRIRFDRASNSEHPGVFALLQETPVEAISQRTGLEPNAIYAVKNRMTERLERERKEIEEIPVHHPNSPVPETR